MTNDVGLLLFRLHPAVPHYLVYIQPPSVEELERRLKLRGTDSAEMIAKRVAKASYELTFAPKFDVVIVNDKLEEAQMKALSTIKSFLNV